VHDLRGQLRILSLDVAREHHFDVVGDGLHTLDALCCPNGCAALGVRRDRSAQRDGTLVRQFPLPPGCERPLPCGCRCVVGYSRAREYKCQEGFTSSGFGEAFS
jgi:hypothetical protein